MVTWRELLESALERNEGAAARFLQLGTVDANGRPAVRTVVFRGFRGGTDAIKIVVDGRSDKIGHLLHQPWAELCWYFADTREQFRLAGSCTLVTAQTTDTQLRQERIQAWRQLSDAARAQYLWLSPGLPRQAEPLGAALPDPMEPLATFVLLLVQPEQVDYLRLRGEPHERALFVREADGAWGKTAVNP